MAGKERELWTPGRRALAFRTARFVIVGAAATVLYLGTAFAIVASGAAIQLAHVVAWCVSVLFSYLGQKIFTFGIRGEHRRNGPRFLLALAAVSALQFGLVLLLTQLGVESRIVLLTSAVFYPVVSFFLHSFWTFARGSAP